MKSFFRLFVVAAISLLGLAVRAKGSPVTWTFSDVVFSDGSSVTGYFNLDASVALPPAGLTDYQSVVSGGSVLPAFTYTPQDPLSQLLVYFYNDASGHTREAINPFRRNPLAYELLYLSPVAFLNNSGGAVTLDSANSTGQLSNGETTVASTRLVSGSLVGTPAATPEPGSLVLVLLGTFSALTYRQLRQGRRSFSSFRLFPQ